ncbi:nucleotidyltransferase domain-containing protein [Candidatus Harpocratesius sp.]
MIIQKSKKKIKQEILSKFHNFIFYIKNNYDVHAFILFGSQSRNEALFYSDYDLLIIGNFDTDYMQRTKKMVQHLPTDVAVDLFCYSVEEFESMMKLKRKHILDALDHGIPIFGEEFIKRYRSLKK